MDWKKKPPQKRFTKINLLHKICKHDSQKCKIVQIDIHMAHWHYKQQ